MSQLPATYKNNKENSDEKVMFPPIPGGKYLAVIEESDYAPNKERTGMNLKLIWQIIEGPENGKKIFEYICLEHQKISVSQQAQRTMNRINDLCGFPEGNRVSDSLQLHNIPMKIEVECKIENDFPNSIKKHEPAEGATVTPPVTQASSPDPAGLHPWEKK